MSDWSHLLSDRGGQPGFWSYLDVSLQPHGRKRVLNWKFQLGEVAAEVSESGLGGERTPRAEPRWWVGCAVAMPMETEKTGTDWKQAVGTGAKLCVHSTLGTLWRKEVNSKLIQSAVLAQGCRAHGTE